MFVISAVILVLICWLECDLCFRYSCEKFCAVQLLLTQFLIGKYIKTISSIKR